MNFIQNTWNFDLKSVGFAFDKPRTNIEKNIEKKRLHITQHCLSFSSNFFVAME